LAIKACIITQEAGYQVTRGEHKTQNDDFQGSPEIRETSKNKRARLSGQRLQREYTRVHRVPEGAHKNGDHPMTIRRDGGATNEKSPQRQRAPSCGLFQMRQAISSGRKRPPSDETFFYADRGGHTEADYSSQAKKPCVFAPRRIVNGGAFSDADIMQHTRNCRAVYSNR